jgi:hypothetical protein
MEHQHRHTMHTECVGDNCNREHNEVFEHTHDGGHEYHNHRLAGMKLVKTDDTKEEVEEEEPEKEPNKSFGF